MRRKRETGNAPAPATAGDAVPARTPTGASAGSTPTPRGTGGVRTGDLRTGGFGTGGFGPGGQGTGGTAPSNPTGASAPLSSDDPDRLGQYELTGRLGEGGMGTVFLGRDPDGRLVAVKMIRPDLARLAEFRVRFRREADVARRVARFCTAEVLDVVDPDDGLPYLVTEYVDGLTLAQAVAVEGPLRSADLERVAVSVAAALTAIHGAGLVHRDLKPSNVLLSTLGPRVIDFGIARALNAQTMVSQEIQRIGTPAFMAPEQANGEPVTAAADIFAWGGLVTYAGTGSYPFGDGPTPVQLYRVVHREPLLDGLDPALRPIVEHAMRKDPAQRPTAQELFLRLVGMGPATHPDPDVTRMIRTGSPLPVAAQPARTSPSADGVPAGDGSIGDGSAGTGPVGTVTPLSLPAQAGRVAQVPAAGAVTGTPRTGGALTTDTPPGTAGPVTTGPASATTGGTGGAAGRAGGAAGATGGSGGDSGVRSGATVSPDEGPRAGTAQVERRWTRRRIGRYGTPAIALLLVAVLIPLALTRSGADRVGDAEAATRVAAEAETVRGSDADLAGRLSLAAFRISPVPAARGSLRTSFAAGTAKTLEDHTGSVLGLGVSPDGRTVATAGADDLIRLWDVEDRQAPEELATLDAHGAWALDAAFSPDGTVLATVGYDRAVRLWGIADPSEPSELATMFAHNGYVLDAEFSPDGSILATSGYDNTARLWDVSDPSRPVELAVLDRHTSWVNEVTFAPTGTLLATASADRSARLWDIADPRRPRPLATITAHTDYVWTTAFSPDGRRLATGGYDGQVRIWDVTDPSRPGATAAFQADEKWVFDVTFSPDGQTLASAGWDTTVHLWDLTTPGTPGAVGRIGGHGDWVQAVEFSPDGSALVTVSDDFTARISRIDDAGLVAAACSDPDAQISEAEWRRWIPDVPYRPVC